MAAFYADENFPIQVVEALRALGHDVLTARDAGQADRAVPDDEVLAFATARDRALLTLNRWDFVEIHGRGSGHAGIIACTPDPDTAGQAGRIDRATRDRGTVAGELLRIDRPA